MIKILDFSTCKALKLCDSGGHSSPQGAPTGGLPAAFRHRASRRRAAPRPSAANFLPSAAASHRSQPQLRDQRREAARRRAGLARPRIDSPRLQSGARPGAALAAISARPGGARRGGVTAGPTWSRGHTHTGGLGNAQKGKIPLSRKPRWCEGWCTAEGSFPFRLDKTYGSKKVTLWLVCFFFKHSLKTEI